jgi:hypothetical protein
MIMSDFEKALVASSLAATGKKLTPHGDASRLALALNRPRRPSKR